jgi:Domain of unknown function (DUF4270)
LFHRLKLSSQLFSLRRVEKNSFRKIKTIGKSIGFVSLTCLVFLMISCEDDQRINFSNRKNNLQTVYIDTFSVVTSTILADSIPTSNSGVVLVGGYNDNLVGAVSSSSYFQIGYLSKFLPESTSVYDSIGLVLPYSRNSYGDTTKSLTINVHELIQSIKVRSLPQFVAIDKPSPLRPSNALFNTSQVNYNPTPIVSKVVRFYPHRDSLYIPLPTSLGQKWYGIAKADTSFHFKDVNRFVSDYFKGIYLESASGTNASIAAFKLNKTKIRIYYRRLVGDVLTASHFDLPIVNPFNQFNQISSDRSSSSISSLSKGKALSSTLSQNVSYVQSGEGLITKIEFPTLKGFFKNKNIVLIDAVLDVIAVQKTYDYFKAPASLSLYATDQSNTVLGGISSGNGILSAPIRYDYEYGLDTKYSFSLINFLNSEIITDTQSITPIAILSPAISTEVNRVALGNRFHPTNKIKLKIYYSQYATN